MVLGLSAVTFTLAVIATTSCQFIVFEHWNSNNNNSLVVRFDNHQDDKPGYGMFRFERLDEHTGEKTCARYPRDFRDEEFDAGIEIAQVSPGAGANITVEVVPRRKLQRAVPQAACFVVP